MPMVSKDQEKEKKKKQREAKKKLVSLYKELKKIHEKYEEVQEIIDQLESILKEYEDYLPQNVKETLQKATRLSDRTPDGIKTALDNLNAALEFVETALPGSMVSTSVIAGIAIAATVAGIAISAYFIIMVDVDIINDGDKLDLNGFWKTEQGIVVDALLHNSTQSTAVVEIIHSGNSITAVFVEDDCSAGPRDFFIRGELQGTSLTGTLKRCLSPDHRLVTKCGLEQVLETPFEATAGQTEIIGERQAQWWILDKDENGNVINCRFDYYYPEAFSLTREDKTTEEQPTNLQK